MRRRCGKGAGGVLTGRAGNGWIAGGGNTVSAQTGEIRDCHYALVQGGTTWRGDWRGYGAAGRGGDTDGEIEGSPQILLLDECTGNTWILNGRNWQSLNR